MNGQYNNSYGRYAPYNSYNISTNVIRVTSLEEAVMQTTRRPSDMVYFNQDKDEFYNVKVDVDGRKTWATFQYTLPNPDATVPVTKADFTLLVNRIEELERKIGGNVDAKLDG